MPKSPRRSRCTVPIVLLAFLSLLSRSAYSASCITQSQMTPAQRDALSNAAHTLLVDIQAGNVQALRSLASPSIAAQFQGLVGSVSHLQPLVKSAAITVDEIYLLDATDESPGQTATEFYCGSPVVSLNFTGLPAGNYALAIVHATGVPHPEQIAVIFANVVDHGWMLAGMFDKPMTEAGHDGIWYWTSARKFAQEKSAWPAWFYYQIAANLLDPIEFLSSPNLEMLQKEADQIRPSDLPGSAPMSFNAQGSLYELTAVDTSTQLGGLDLDVHYQPDPAQTAQLHDPSAARQQVLAIMAELLKMHPALRDAFHGIWVHADQGNESLFALELPMQQISPGISAPATSATPPAR